MFLHDIKPIIIKDHFDKRDLEPVIAGDVGGLLIQEQLPPEIKQQVDRFQVGQLSALAGRFFNVSQPPKLKMALGPLAQDVMPEAIYKIAATDIKRLYSPPETPFLMMTLNIHLSLNIKWHLDPVPGGHLWTHRQLSDHLGSRVLNPDAAIPVNDIGRDEICISNKDVEDIARKHPQKIVPMQQGHVLYFNSHCAHVSASELRPGSMRYTIV